MATTYIPKHTTLISIYCFDYGSGVGTGQMVILKQSHIR